MSLIKIITYLYRLYTGLSYPYAPPKVKIHVIAKDRRVLLQDNDNQFYYNDFKMIIIKKEQRENIKIK